MKTTFAILALLVFATDASTHKEEVISNIIHEVVQTVENSGMMTQRRMTTATTKNGRQARGTRSIGQQQDGASATRRLKKNGFSLSSKGKNGPDTCCEFIAGLFQLEAACFAAYQAADLEAICDLEDFGGPLSSSSKGSDPVEEYRDAQDAFFDFLDDFGLDGQGPELIDECDFSGPTAGDTTPDTDDFFLFNSFSFEGYCLGGANFFANDDDDNFGAFIDDFDYDDRDFEFQGTITSGINRLRTLAQHGF